MATTPGRIFVPGDAHVYLGPVGTAVPAALDGPFTGYTEVGLFTNDSLKFSTDPTFESIYSHQSRYPTRENETESTGLLEVDLQEWSGDNFIYVYGGGSVAEIGTTDVFKFTPPAAGERDEVAAIVHLVDGDKMVNLVIPRCMQKTGVEHDLSSSGSADTGSILPLRLSLLGGGSGDPFYWISDDTAFDPA